MSSSNRRRQGRQKGSALLTAILVILILTVIGLGIAYFTQVEDRISGNDRIAKEGFYAAEVGLRTGERLIQNAVTNIGDVSNLYATSVPTIVLPDGTTAGQLALPSVGAYPMAVDLAAVPGAGATTIDRGQFTLYIQNNIEDLGGPVNETDQPARMNLISIGVVQLANGSLGITKILEEQLLIAIAGTGAETQKQKDAGGTGGSLRK